MAQGFIEKRGVSREIETRKNLTVRQAFERYKGLRQAETKKTNWKGAKTYDKSLKLLEKFIDVDKVTLDQLNSDEILSDIFESDQMLQGWDVNSKGNKVKYAATNRNIIGSTISPIISEAFGSENNTFEVWRDINLNSPNVYSGDPKFPHAPNTTGFDLTDRKSQKIINLPEINKFHQALDETLNRIEASNVKVQGVPDSLVKAHLKLSAITGLRGPDIKSLMIDSSDYYKILTSGDSLVGAFDDLTHSIYIGNKARPKMYPLNPVLWSILDDARKVAAREKANGNPVWKNKNVIFPESAARRIETHYFNIMTQVFKDMNIELPQYDLTYLQSKVGPETPDSEVDRYFKTDINGRKIPKNVNLTHNILRKFVFTAIETESGTATADEVIGHTGGGSNKSEGIKSYRGGILNAFQRTPARIGQDTMVQLIVQNTNVDTEYDLVSKVVSDSNNIHNQVGKSPEQISKSISESNSDIEKVKKIKGLGYRDINKIYFLINQYGVNAYREALERLKAQAGNIQNAENAISDEIDLSIAAKNQNTSEAKVIAQQIIKQNFQATDKAPSSKIEQATDKKTVLRRNLEATLRNATENQLDENKIKSFLDRKNFTSVKNLKIFLTAQDAEYMRSGAETSSTIDNLALDNDFYVGTKEKPTTVQTAANKIISKVGKKTLKTLIGSIVTAGSGSILMGLAAEEALAQGAQVVRDEIDPELSEEKADPLAGFSRVDPLKYDDPEFDLAVDESLGEGDLDAGLWNRTQPERWQEVADLRRQSRPFQEYQFTEDPRSIEEFRGHMSDIPRISDTPYDVDVAKQVEQLTGIRDFGPELQNRLGDEDRFLSEMQEGQLSPVEERYAKHTIDKYKRRQRLGQEKTTEDQELDPVSLEQEQINKAQRALGQTPDFYKRQDPTIEQKLLMNLQNEFTT